jgi:hypothetical protein
LYAGHLDLVGTIASEGVLAICILTAISVGVLIDSGVAGFLTFFAFLS